MKFVTIKNIIIVFVFFAIGFLVFNGAQGRLRIEAWRNQRYLSNLRVVNDQKVKATASPNGDFLTGNSSPAKGALPVQGTLDKLIPEVSKNLQDQGFSISDKFDFLVGNYSNPGGLNLRAWNGNKLLNIQFIFKEQFMCVEGTPIYQLCKFSQPIAVNGSGLTSTQIKEIILKYVDGQWPPK